MFKFQAFPPLALLLSFGAISCDHKDPEAFTLHAAEVTHVEDCHIKMLSAAYDKDPPFLSMVYVCGLPESDLNGFPKNDPRWATHPTPPLAFTMSPGDCLRLNKTFYCVETIKPGEASFKAGFKKVDGHEPLIKRIR